ncbi:hypothetical protein FACS1894142_3790 [Spirochaetia bacterium]|nr:hypothetical protein FACS1894142_3790 [Spirochaetia bacterium]
MLSKKKFILLFCLGYGGLNTLLNIFIIYVISKEDYATTTMIVNTIVFLLCGLLFGRFMWSVKEEEKHTTEPLPK